MHNSKSQCWQCCSETVAQWYGGMMAMAQQYLGAVTVIHWYAGSISQCYSAMNLHVPRSCPTSPQTTKINFLNTTLRHQHNTFKMLKKLKHLQIYSSHGTFAQQTRLLNWQPVVLMVPLLMMSLRRYHHRQVASALSSWH